ncbi:MAG: hypothetical protein M5U17_16605 [Ignavibacterium sp.]|nr:hypothetical protein [Ignavibacterium sp.]
MGWGQHTIRRNTIGKLLACVFCFFLQKKTPDKGKKLRGGGVNAGQSIAHSLLAKVPRARIISPVSLSGKPVKDVNDLPAKDLEAWLASEGIFPQPRALL